MKTIIQLRETFDRPIPLTWKGGPATKPLYKITASGKLRDGQRIMIVFEDQGGHVTIAFSVGATVKQTGKGNSLEVFATVIAAIDTFMQKYDKPNIISFTSDKEDSLKDSRGKLYIAMVNRMTKKYNYKIDLDELGPFTVFILKKKV